MWGGIAVLLDLLSLPDDCSVCDAKGNFGDPVPHLLPVKFHSSETISCCLQGQMPTVPPPWLADDDFDWVVTCGGSFKPWTSCSL